MERLAWQQTRTWADLQQTESQTPLLVWERRTNPLVIHALVQPCRGFDWDRWTEASACELQAAPRKKNTFNDPSGLNSLSSCTVVISRALRAVKITAALMPPPSWKQAHYSSSPYQRGPTAGVAPFPIADLWLQGSWGVSIFSLWHTHTHKPNES